MHGKIVGIAVIMTILSPSIIPVSSQNELAINEANWKELMSADEKIEFCKGSNVAIRGMAVYKDELYLGTQSFNQKNVLSYKDIILAGFFPLFLKLFKNQGSLLELIACKMIFRFMHLRSRASDGCQVWKYNYSDDKCTQLVGPNPDADLPAGFGDTKTIAASIIIEFKGDLYVGTWNTPKGIGGELWRYDGNSWEQVVGRNAKINGGFNNSDNNAFWSAESFNDHLYIGTMNWNCINEGGCQIWRSEDGNTWEKVVDRGFRDFLPENQQFFHNSYAWDLKVYKDKLYAGTFNCNSLFKLPEGGCQLWRTDDGENWEKVDIPNGNGFGNEENYGIRRMEVYKDELYVAVAANAYQFNGENVQACELWKYDGMNWTQIIGDQQTNPYEKDGFGSRYNKYIWSMTVTSDDYLWVGTLNTQHLRFMNEDTKGCEVWRYDGSKWEPIAKTGEGEIDSGFGYGLTQGARAMIEYPIGSNNIVIGTFTMVKPWMQKRPCDIWTRYYE